MEPNEMDHTRVLGERIVRALDRLWLCLEGMNSRQINWRPPVAGSNTLYSIIIHALGAAEEATTTFTQCQETGSTLKQQIMRCDRHQFFSDGPLEVLSAVFHEERDVIAKRLQSLDGMDLTISYSQNVHIYPESVALTGYAILLNLLEHLYEHVGQSQVIRDFVFKKNEECIVDSLLNWSKPVSSEKGE